MLNKIAAVIGCFLVFGAVMSAAAGHFGPAIFNMLFAHMLFSLSLYGRAE